MIEDMNFRYDATCGLDQYAQGKISLQDVDKNILGKYIDRNYIDEANRICTSDYTPESVSAYNAKVTLLPLQKIIERAQK